MARRPALPALLLSAPLLFGPLAPPAAAQPILEPLSRENVQDWVLECFGPIFGCQLYQRMLMDGETVALVTAITVQPGTPDLDIEMALPYGGDLQKGVEIIIDNSFAIEAPFSRCTTQGCLVEATLTDELTDMIRNADTLGVRMAVPPDDSFFIPLSTEGLAEGLQRLKDKVPVVTPEGAERPPRRDNQASAAPEAETAPRETTPPNLRIDNTESPGIEPR